MAPADLPPTAVLDAAYDLDGAGSGPALCAPWVTRVAEALDPLLGREFGTVAYTVDATRPEAPIGAPIAIRVQPGAEALPSAAVAQLGEHEWRRLHATQPRVSLATEVMTRLFGPSHVWKEHLGREIHARFGFDDVLGITATPPVGPSVQFTFARRRAPLPRAERRWLERLAALIEAGLRLRHAAEQIDAVLDPRGRLLHAEGDATAPDARAALHDAVRERARVRSARALDPVSAIDRWTALVLGRWSVVDRVDTDGQRFLIARRNDATEPLEPWMTTRVRQVAQLVARGLSNKHIAYELGLAESTVSRTVRELLGRLGLRSRYELAALLRGTRP